MLLPAPETQGRGAKFISSFRARAGPRVPPPADVLCPSPLSKSGGACCCLLRRHRGGARSSYLHFGPVPVPEFYRQLTCSVLLPYRSPAEHVAACSGDTGEGREVHIFISGPCRSQSSTAS